MVSIVKQNQISNLDIEKSCSDHATSSERMIF